MRDEAAAAREEIRVQRLDEIMTKQTKRSEIKMHEERMKVQREEERQLVVENNRRNYEEKIEAQARASASKEREVARMERVEMQLIQQLKKTQVMQQHAFEDLEHALNGELSKVKGVR